MSITVETSSALPARSPCVSEGTPGLSIDRKGPYTLGYMFYQMFQRVASSSLKADEWQADIEEHEFRSLKQQRDVISELNMFGRLEAFVSRLGGRVDYRKATLKLLDELKQSRQFFTFPTIFDQFVRDCESRFHEKSLRSDDRGQFRDLITQAHALISTSDEKTVKNSRRPENSRRAEDEEVSDSSTNLQVQRGRKSKRDQSKDRSRSTGDHSQKPDRRDRSEERLCTNFHDERKHFGWRYLYLQRCLSGRWNPFTRYFHYHTRLSFK